MIKRKLWIVLMCVVVLAFTGCNGKNKVDKKDTEVSGDVSENETVTENKNATEETQTTDNKKNDTTTNKNESTSNKNETTTKPSTGSNNNTTKPNTGSTGNTGSTNNSGNTGNTQNNSTSTTTQPSTPAHTHSWTEVRETVVVKGAWVEDVYAWRTICGRCGLDMTEMTDEELTIHTVAICNSRYSAKYIKIDEIQHPAVTEERVTGYKCSCGATK